MLVNTFINKREKPITVIKIARIEKSSARSKKGLSLKNEELELILERLITLRTSRPNPPSGLGNPGPLGLGAFGLTTFMFSVFNAGPYLIDPQLLPVVIPVALFYGGIAQFAAGMWEYRVNNTFGATTFASYGGFWMSFAGYAYLIVPQITPTQKVKKATGLFLLSWFIFTLYMNVAAWRVSKAIFSVFIVLSLTFLSLVIGNLADISVFINIGGWFGIVTAFLAWYASAAVIINDTFGKSILPIGTYKKEEKKSTSINIYP
jgi:succinate-acetate transporter protein